MNNFSKINWDPILSEVRVSRGEIRTMGEKFYENKNGEFNEIIMLWENAGYNSNKVEWINFYPNKHFDINVEKIFSEEVSLKPLRSWISCVRPGKNAPWHKDIDDNLTAYQSLGTLERYTCYIDNPSEGQVLMIDKECYYMKSKGTIIKWPDYMAWHGSSNCGFENHYLYHFLGYK